MAGLAEWARSAPSQSEECSRNEGGNRPLDSCFKQSNQHHMTSFEQRIYVATLAMEYFLISKENVPVSEWRYI